MEFIRKQKVIRQSFGFRMIVFLLSSLCCVLYVFYSDRSPQIWGIVIGISASALVWSIVEICDFFINTYYRYETERTAFLKITITYFGKIKDIIRDNVEEIPMHDIKQVINDLYSEMNNFIFTNNLYPISSEFEKCSHYIERMFWKFYACCWNIHDDCEEKEEYYKKLCDCIIKREEVTEKTSKRFFNALYQEKIRNEMTNIELSFNEYCVDKDYIKKDIIGNIGETFTIPDNVYVTYTFIPDLDFDNLYRKDKSNMVCTVLNLIFRKINYSNE